MGDQVRTRGVHCPVDIVKRLFNDLDAVYPPLRGVTTSPSFTAGGDMIRYGLNPCHDLWAEVDEMSLKGINKCRFRGVFALFIIDILTHCGCAI